MLSSGLLMLKNHHLHDVEKSKREKYKSEGIKRLTHGAKKHLADINKVNKIKNKHCEIILIK